jgi:hypothetical protein
MKSQSEHKSLGRKTPAPPKGNKQKKKRAIAPGDFTVSQPGMNLQSIPMGFPYRKEGKLRYCDSVTLAGSTSATTSYAFSANGIFDPDVTGTGHQPMFFDEMMHLYNHYTVTASRIRAIVENTTGGPARAGLMISGTTTVSSDFRVNTENGEMSYVVLESKSTAGYGSAATLTRAVNAGHFQGVVNVLDDPDMRGDAASNPAEQLYFIVLLWNPVSSAIPGIQIDVAIEYDVIFHEPRKGVLS